jgi:hypothetical protein
LSIFATKIGHPEKGEKKGEKRIKKKGAGKVRGCEKSESKTKRNFSLSLSQPSFLSSFLCFLLVVVVFVNRRCIPTTEMRACIRRRCVCRCPASEQASEREAGAGSCFLDEQKEIWMNRERGVNGPFWMNREERNRKGSEAVWMNREERNRRGSEAVWMNS